MRRLRRRVKKKIKNILIVIIILIILFGSILYFNHEKKIELENNMIKKEEELVSTIKNSYNKYIKVKKGSTLYKKEDNKYIEVLKINSEKDFTLSEINIDKNTKYFYIEELKFYVRYQDVIKIDNLVTKDLRYKNYLPFNENVVTKDSVNLYQNNEVIYELYFKLDVPIIEKCSEGVYVDINNELYLIKNEDISSTYEKENTTIVEATSVPVTVYHFIYLEGDTSCREAICHSEKQIRSHFNYLRENNFFTLNTTELGKFIDGNIRLPEKSLLITIDDGARAWNFVPLLEEYQVNATLFLVSSWYDKTQFASPYMEIASHTHNLHTPRVCSGGQGSPLKCADREMLVNDLKTSRETLNGTKAFCFPFYEYNDYALSVIEEAGFEMGFIGGHKNATKGINKLKIPRVPLTDYTTLEQYIKIIS